MDMTKIIEKIIKIMLVVIGLVADVVGLAGAVQTSVEVGAPKYVTPEQLHTFAIYIIVLILGVGLTVGSLLAYQIAKLNIAVSPDYKSKSWTDKERDANVFHVLRGEIQAAEQKTVELKADVISKDTELRRLIKENVHAISKINKQTETATDAPGPFDGPQAIIDTVA